MFGIGGFELFLILLFGFLIFGPDRLPRIARTIGNAISRFRNASDDMNKTLQNAQNEMFNKNSAEPFKNPLDVIENMTGTAVTATGAAQTTQGTSAAKPIASATATLSAEDTPSQEGVEHAESFAERKARYENERAERKAAEKKAAEQAATEVKEAACADPADDIADKTVTEATDSKAVKIHSADTSRVDKAETDSATVATEKADTAIDLEKKEA